MDGNATHRPFASREHVPGFGYQAVEYRWSKKVYEAMLAVVIALEPF